VARSWGFWTRYKLELLERYLNAFTTATKLRSRKAVYLDLFGGEPENTDRLTQDLIEGSARIALNAADPPFTHLRFFELPSNAAKLEESLVRDYPERDWKVYSGDSNDTIFQALAELCEADAQWAPTFAFIDPNGPHYKWATLQALARHKGSRAKTKVELWMLFPTPLFARMLPRTGITSRRVVSHGD
jgi:three-Cys-motif partner protein